MSFRLMGLMLCVVALILVAARLIIILAIQFPAPSGDSILFLSTSIYACRENQFHTPIFPLDPLGEARYIWHGIGHPWLIRILNPGCDNVGAHIALSLLLSFSFILSYFYVRRTGSVLLSLMSSVVVFSLLSKVGFRPEVTAVVLVILSEHARIRGRHVIWVVSVSLIAWVQPSAFLLHIAYVAATIARTELINVTRDWGKWLGAAGAVNFVIARVYPFPISDLLVGLLLQGRRYSPDGLPAGHDLWTYFIRSDFFPLIGALFLVALVFHATQYPRLVLLAPLFWLLGVSRPATFYNLVPVLTLMFLRAAAQVDRNSQAKCSINRLVAGAVVGFGALIAVFGLSQSVARDVSSYYRFGATLERSMAAFREVRASGLEVCKVPAFFTLFLPSSYFKNSLAPTAKSCASGIARPTVDLVEASGARASSKCVLVFPDQGRFVFGNLFNSDSGYSFHLCE